MDTTVDTKNEPVTTGYAVTLLAPAGMGYGAGDVSYAGRQGDQNDAALRETVKAGTVLVPVDTSDGDSCSEGLALSSDVVSPQLPKVFGGGMMAALAIAIGTGGALEQGLNAIVASCVDTLKRQGIAYGAHVDIHSPDGLCGCRVIDMLPDIIANISTFRPQILGTISALGMNMGSVDEVMTAFANYAEIHGKADSFRPRQAIDDMHTAGAVIADVKLQPNEIYVIFNNATGTTVDQHAVQAASDGQARVYAIDAWYLKAFSQQLYSNDMIAAHKAAQSCLIFTFGVLATLTKGDLPVFSIDQA